MKIPTQGLKNLLQGYDTIHDAVEEEFGLGEVYDRVVLPLEKAVDEALKCYGFNPAQIQEDRNEGKSLDEIFRD